MPVRADAVSAYIKALDEALADRFDGYRAHLEAAPLAAQTRRCYAGRVAGYLSWLAELDPLTRRAQGDPFIDGRARDYTVRDYRTHLLLGRPGQARLGQPHPGRRRPLLPLHRARSRQHPPRTAAPGGPPGPLDADQTRRLLRAAERTATDPGGVRGRAIACVLLFTGLRIAGLVALDSYAGSPAGLAHSGVRSRCSAVGKLLLLLVPAF